MSSSTRLFVGNLPNDTNEKDLQTLFSSFGNVTHLDLKHKSPEDSKNSFAFVTLSASVNNVETCISHFTNEIFHGNKLYVARARESFLERLQRERLEASCIEKKKEVSPKKHITIRLGDELTPHKRKYAEKQIHRTHKQEKHKQDYIPESNSENKKQKSDDKRMESLKKKRQEFKEKKNIIKSGLVGIDLKKNRKIIFPEHDLEHTQHSSEAGTVNNDQLKARKRKNIFEEGDDDHDDGDLNFHIKKQYEGKSGQKVLNLQSSYKSDKRFILDERFIEEEEPDKDNDASQEVEEEEHIDLGQKDEKNKQLDILQDVLGVSIKSNISQPVNNKKAKAKLGMLRFDPLQPEHAKFLAPLEENLQKKKNKKKTKEQLNEEVKLDVPELEVPKVEVSKEQFYKISDTFKESIAQPTTFSLRSLFGNNEENDKSLEAEDSSYKTMEISKDQKKKHPLDLGEKNPFVYDSSDSENEETNIEIQSDLVPTKSEVKHVWKENLFFSESDIRLREGLTFFNKIKENETHKERRELKSVMKKRIYNKERKNQMFQKKIGGRKKSMKKSFKVKQ